MRLLYSCVAMWGLSVSAALYPEGATRIDSMMMKADAVIHAEVTGLVVARNPNDGVPHTFYRMLVHDVISGSVLPSEVVVRIMGADMANEVWSFFGTPFFEVGEHIVVFLRNNGDAEVPIVSGHKGVFWANVSHDGGRYITDADGFPVTGVDKGSIEVDRTSTVARCIQAALIPEVREVLDSETQAPRLSSLACPHEADQIKDTIRLDQFKQALAQVAANPSPRTLRSIPFGKFDDQSLRALEEANRPVPPPKVPSAPTSGDTN